MCPEFSNQASCVWLAEVGSNDVSKIEVDADKTGYAATREVLVLLMHVVSSGWFLANRTMPLYGGNCGANDVLDFRSFFDTCLLVTCA